MVTQFEKLLQMAEEGNGLIFTKDVLNAGISKTMLAAFVEKYEFMRVDRGAYCSPDSFSEFDIYYLLQHRCPEVVFSHETALYLHGMAEREPNPLEVTVKNGYNPSRLTKNGIKVYTSKEDLYEMGVTEVETPYGNKVRVYDMERTICDVIRYRKKMEVLTYSYGIREYFLWKRNNLDKLYEYAKKMRIDDTVMEYIRIFVH